MPYCTHYYVTKYTTTETQSESSLVANYQKGGGDGPLN